MKLYNAKMAPNPHLVRIFLAEKGIEMPIVDIDLMGGENRREPYISKINPLGYLPTLELDDGSTLSEVTAICEYLEELYPTPPLIGKTPEERAQTRMWTRRIDLEIMAYMAQGFRGAEGQQLFKDRVRTYPQCAEEFKKGAQDGLAWLNAQMEGKAYICGDRFTLADISLYAWLAFIQKVGQPLDEANTNLVAWMERVGARPSASA